MVQVCELYDVAFVISDGQDNHLIDFTLEVVECDLRHQGFDVLIGRDVLNRIKLIYDGLNGEATIFF